MMVLWGHLSPQLMQKIMSLLKADLALFQDGCLDTAHIDKLAGLGCNGTYPNNIWSQFKAMLPQPKLPKLQMIWLPMKHTTLGKITKLMPMLLPHTLFSAIYHHYPDMWQRIFYPGAEKCKEFWHAVRDSPHFLQHDVGSRPGFESKCIPLKIHGDGTPVTGLGKGWGKLVDIFSCSSILTTGPTILRNLMIFLIFQHLMCVEEGHNTLDQAYKMWIWSFAACWTGKKPKYDWNGEEMFYAGAGDDLCGGFFFAVWALICDLEHGYKCYNFPNPTANICCPLCPCNALDIPWFDFRPTAAWLNHIWTVQSWLASGLKRSLIMRIEGVSILSFYPDWMHCKSLGIDKPLLGSVLWLLVHHVMPGEVEENLQNVWQDIQVIYDKLDSESRYGFMRQTMFTTKSQPKLKGKAAEVKDMGPVMVLIWKKYHNPNLLIHLKILVVLEGSAHCDEILENHPSHFALPTAEADDLIATAFIYLSTWYEVFNHFKDLDLPLFGLTGKAHIMLHACLLSRSGVSHHIKI